MNKHFCRLVYLCSKFASKDHLWRFKWLSIGFSAFFFRHFKVVLNFKKEFHLEARTITEKLSGHFWILVFQLVGGCLMMHQLIEVMRQRRTWQRSRLTMSRDSRRLTNVPSSHLWSASRKVIRRRRRRYIGRRCRDNRWLGCFCMFGWIRTVCLFTLALVQSCFGLSYAMYLK